VGNWPLTNVQVQQYPNVTVGLYLPSVTPS